MVRCQSGRTELTANESYFRVPGVRIPPSPSSKRSLALVAQSVERTHGKGEVASSILVQGYQTDEDSVGKPTKCHGTVAQLVRARLS